MGSLIDSVEDGSPSSVTFGEVMLTKSSSESDAPSLLSREELWLDKLNGLITFT